MVEEAVNPEQKRKFLKTEGLAVDEVVNNLLMNFDNVEA